MEAFAEANAAERPERVSDRTHARQASFCASVEKELQLARATLEELDREAEVNKAARQHVLVVIGMAEAALGAGPDAPKRLHHSSD